MSSSESSGIDHNSSSENIELKEFARNSEGYSDLESDEDFTTSCGPSSKQSETKENEINNQSIVTDLNISDENHHEFDVKLGSFNSLKGISLGDLTRTRKLSSLTKKASSLEETSISSSLEVSSLEPLKGSSTRRASSLDPLKESSSRRVSSVDPLEEPSTKNVSSLDPFGRPSTKKTSSLSSLERLATRRVSSLDPLERPLTRTVWFSDSTKGSSTSNCKSQSLDTLEGLSTRTVSFSDSSEGYININCKSQSLDPLEGPSTRTVFLSHSSEGSLTSIDQLPNSETETNEPSNSELPTEQNGCCIRMLTWLSSFLRRYSSQLKHSKYYAWLHWALFSLPLSASYMGAKYYSMCDGCRDLPFSVYLLGILGMGILIARLASILSSRYFTPHLTGRELNLFLGLLLILFLLFLVVEMFITYKCEPVFIPRVSTMKEFCYVVFYNYANYMNVAVPLVILLLVLIHILGLCDPAEAE